MQSDVSCNVTHALFHTCTNIAKRNLAINPMFHRSRQNETNKNQKPTTNSSSSHTCYAKVSLFMIRFRIPSTGSKVLLLQVESSYIPPTHLHSTQWRQQTNLSQCYDPVSLQLYFIIGLPVTHFSLGK